MFKKIMELKNDNNNNISYLIENDHFNKKAKKDEKLNMFIIITKEMMKEIRNKIIYQYFGDTNYRFIPPSFRSYRLYVISGFNMMKKRTRILSYILIPNETEKTYKVYFSNLKNKFCFNPRLFNMDFNKASCKAIKSVYPNIYIVKCFFHFTQYLYKKLKQLGLTKIKFKDDILELLFNLKRLSLINPKEIPILYKKIKNKYNKKNIQNFIHILKKFGSLYVNLKNIKSFQIGIIIIY